MAKRVSPLRIDFCFILLLATLFELKVRKKFNEMEDGIEEAFTQIRDQKYEEGILDEGYAGVISFGVCFCKKSCIVERYNA